MGQIQELTADNINNMEPIIAKNQQLVQKLNNGAWSSAEVRQQVTTITNQVVDDSVEIRLPFYTDFGRNIHFGKDIFINSGVMFTDPGGIYLGDGVLIGPNVTLATVNHPLEPAKRHENELQPIKVMKNAWVGANATVVPGVTIGENAVVAAGAVVTRNVPKNTVVAGVPARVIKVLKK